MSLIATAAPSFDLTLVLIEQLRLVILPLAPSIVGSVRSWLVGKPKWVPVTLCAAIGVVLGVVHQYAAAAAAGQVDVEPWVGALVGLVLAVVGNKARDVISERGERVGERPVQYDSELPERRGSTGI